MPSDDLLDSLIEKIAEAVVRKIEEREKIDLIAQAVIARLEEQRGKGGEQAAGDEEATPIEGKPSAHPTRRRRGQRTTTRRSTPKTGQKRGR